MKLFLSSALQVFFVALSTWFIAHEYYVSAVLTSFAISFVWTLNVKKVVFGNWVDRTVYALGASFGAAVALFLTTHI